MSGVRVVDADLWWWWSCRLLRHDRVAQGPSLGLTSGSVVSDGRVMVAGSVGSKGRNKLVLLLLNARLHKRNHAR